MCGCVELRDVGVEFGVGEKENCLTLCFCSRGKEGFLGKLSNVQPGGVKRENL